MKIGFDAKRIFNNQTGLGNYSRTLLDNLYRYFPENDYCLYTPKLGKEEITIPYVQQFKTKTAGTPFKHIWRSYSIRKDLERDQIELYHGLSNEIPFWLKNTKTLVTIHDVIFKILPHTYSQLDRWLYEEKTRYACKYATKIIAISEQTKRDLIHYYGAPADQIAVIHQACQPIFYEPPLPPKPYPALANLPSEYLLYVGSVVERKNLLTLVQVLRQLPASQRLPLVVVGNGKAYKQKVQTYLQANRLEKWVYWLTDLSSVAELKQIYQQAQILVYPSFYEGFGLPVVEAMLCETPVITSNVSALPEAGGALAKYVHPNNVAEMRDGIELLLNDSEGREQMGKTGREDALLRFDPERLTQEMMTVYRELIDG